MQLPDAFIIDERYDRVHASDRRSRFGVYLAQFADMFLDGDGEPMRDPLMFAVSGLEIALPSVMSPPYVAPHRRILRARGHSDDDRRVAVEVDVAAPLPPTAQVFGWRWRSWVSDGASGRYSEADGIGQEKQPDLGGTRAESETGVGRVLQKLRDQRERSVHRRPDE